MFKRLVKIGLTVFMILSMATATIHADAIDGLPETALIETEENADSPTPPITSNNSNDLPQVVLIKSEEYFASRIPPNTLNNSNDLQQPVLIKSQEYFVSRIPPNTLDNSNDLPLMVLIKSEENVVTPTPPIARVVNGPYAYTLNSSNGSQLISYIVTSTYPCAKVWVSNTSSHAYSVTLFSQTPSGSPFDTFTVQPGSTATRWYSWSATTFQDSLTCYVSLTSQDSYPLSGTVSIITASTMNELP